MKTVFDYVILTFSVASYDECAIFIDNSNIFIGGQKYNATRLNLRKQIVRDPRFRINVGKLEEIALDGRTGRYRKVYGSTSSYEDAVWKKMSDQGLSVKVSERNSTGKEKDVDTSMTADAVEYVCDSQAPRQTVIIVSGDCDYYPIVEKIFKRKSDWKVEVLAFRRSISKRLKEIANENDNFKVIELESLLHEHAESCCYVKTRWHPELHRRGTLPNAISLRFKEPLSSPDEQSEKYAIEITRITRIPCFYYVCDWEPNANRWVYIIGWLKDGSGDGNNVFSEICKEKKTLLDETCREICQFYNTMETDDDSLRKHLQESTDRSKEDSNADSGDEDGTLCRYEFRCSYGRDCKDKHRQEEKDFFEANRGKGAHNYKTKRCPFYQRSGCRYGGNEAPNCVFYHSTDEAFDR